VNTITRTLFLLVLGLLTACDREDPIRVYNAPKDPAKPVDTLLASEEPAHREPHIHWTVPQGWRSLPAGQMRYAAFALSDDDPPLTLTVIPLARSGQAAEILPNVNRWEQQLGLPPSTEADLPKVVSTIEVNGLTIHSIDLLGPPSNDSSRQRMLAAILPFDERVWYFKVVGPAERLAAEKPNFDSFLKSISFDSGTHAASPASLAEFSTPSGWQKDPPAAPPRMLSFQIAGGGEVVVTRMESSSFGSLADNINRWRRQLGMEPVADTSAYQPREIPVGQSGGLLFEISSPDKTLLAAMAAVEDDVWFVKLTGPTHIVAEQRGNFESFLKSLRFSAGAPQQGHPAARP